MNKRRLRTLADHLRKLPPSIIRKKCGFNMNLWVHDCGAAACAFGHACTIPSFNRAGLRYDKPRDQPVFNRREGFDAAANFFDIDTGEAHFLFDADRYEAQYELYANGSKDVVPITPKMVAKRIEDLIEGKVTVDQE